MMTSSNGIISALLALCAGNWSVPGEFPSQRPVTRSFDVFFDLRLNKRLSKQSRGWWFETPSRSLWRRCYISKSLHHARGNVTQWSKNRKLVDGRDRISLDHIWSQTFIYYGDSLKFVTWWRHRMETFSALLALCERNPPVTFRFPSQMPLAWSNDVFFVLHLNKR